MKESKLFKSLVATFVVVVLGGPALVLADTPSYVQDAKAIVSYADLNLENEEGLRELYQRLQYASKEICIIIASSNTAESIIINSSRRRATRQCYRDTLSNAVDNFDNEDLTRLHAG